MGELDDKLPKAMADRIKLIPKMAAKETFDKMLRFRELIGEQTIAGTGRVSKEELRKRMAGILTSKEALVKVLVDNMKLSDVDGRLLVRKDFMKEYNSMYEKFKEAGLA